MEMIATRDAYGKKLVELGEKISDIVVLDGDLSKSTKTIDFAKKFPERFFNIGIAEQNIMGTAAGFAAAGKIPFASTFAIFAAGRAWEQIRNTICYNNLNVKIVATHAGISVGADGASHQCTEDISLMRTIPNMTVIVPADGRETERALDAIVKYYGPVYVRLGRAKVPTVTENCDFEIGKGYVLKDGEDITIIATGIMVAEALKASEELSKQNIKARVINIHTIKPLDKEIIIESAKKTKGIITAEEHSVIGGLGDAVSSVVSENSPTKVLKVGIEDLFGESGEPEELMVKYKITANDIVEKAKNILS